MGILVFYWVIKIEKNMWFNDFGIEEADER